MNKYSQEIRNIMLVVLIGVLIGSAINTYSYAQILDKNTKSNFELVEVIRENNKVSWELNETNIKRLKLEEKGKK